MAQHRKREPNSSRENDDALQKQEREEIEQYIRGYQRYPETEEEVMFSWAMLAQVWEECPWEDES